MAETKPFYIYSAEDAKKCGELDLWRESHKENCRCARAIEDAIRNGFDGWYLSQDCAKQVIEQFGFNRVNFVLSNTLREKNYDGRFSPSNKDWSRTIRVPKEDSNWFFTVESHPAVLDGFIDQVRKAWDALGMYDGQHALGNDGDYTGKVLLVSPHWLSEPYKKPEYQLFLAESGFGCSPTASGRKVFGTFLYDGEKTHLNRADFLGVMKEELLPEWAKEKLDAIQAAKAQNSVPAVSNPAEVSATPADEDALEQDDAPAMEQCL